MAYPATGGVKKKDFPARERCGCFTGHRPEKLGAEKDLVVRRLDEAITAAMERGYTAFISGAAKGVDLWAAELVLRHRSARLGIRLVCAVPYRGFGLHWKDGHSELFADVLRRTPCTISAIRTPGPCTSGGTSGW